MYKRQVYHYDENFHFYFIGQGDEFISCAGEQQVVPPFGSLVRIKGHISPGRVSPACSIKTMEILSRDGGRVAAPQAIQLNETLLGVKDCNFVTLDCLVESVRIGTGHTVFGCRQNDTTFTIMVDRTVNTELAATYVGSRVTVTGNLAAEFEWHSSDYEHDVFTGFEIVTNLDDLQVVDRVPELSHARLRTVKEVWQDENASDFHFIGQVTYKNEKGFFLQTMRSGTWIHNDRQMDVAIGNFLRVLGTRDTKGDFYARVHQSKGASPLYQPPLGNITEVVDSKREAYRVQLCGEYMGTRSIGETTAALQLDIEGYRVEVYLTVQQAGQLNLKTAKEITVTGTSSFYTESSDADVVLFTPSLDDVAVSKRTTQWSTGSVAAVAITTIGSLLLCLCWGANLRRQVKQKRLDLEKVSAELRLSYESIREGIVILDRDQCVSYANRRATEVLGFAIRAGTRMDTLRQNIANSGADQNFLAGWDTLNGDPSETNELELELTTDDEQLKTIEVFTSPVNNADGEFVNRLWTFHDITEKQLLHESLAHAQKQEAVGRLASGFAHDFNNLLTGILCSLSVAKSDPSKTIGEASVCIDTAISASERATALVSQILCFSRKRPLNLERHSVNRIIERAETLLSPSLPPDTKLHCNLDPQTPVVEADETQLEQVLLNLLLNANDAIADTGQITMSTFSEKKDGRLHSVISIHDTGCGMTPATRARIFEPFFTSKDNGTGLGLSMSLGIVQQHDGHIECDSVPDVGTEFRIYLPAAYDPLSLIDGSDSQTADSVS